MARPLRPVKASCTQPRVEHLLGTLALERRCSGAGWQQDEQELRQRFPTIRQWCKVATPSGVRALGAVQVVAERGPERRGRMMSPSGIPVEDMSLTEAAVLPRDSNEQCSTAPREPLMLAA